MLDFFSRTDCVACQLRPQTGIRRQEAVGSRQKWSLETEERSQNKE